MKQISTLFHSIYIALIATSCLSHHILIRKDGTAHVQIDIIKNTIVNPGDTIPINYSKEDFKDLKQTFKDFYSSEVINNYKYIYLEDVNEAVIEFDISNVDSLGRYLDPIFDNNFKFTLTSRKLKIEGTDGKSTPEDDPTGIFNTMRIDATIAFEKNIKKIKTKNNYIEQIDQNTIKIKTTIGEMNYNGVGNKTEIFFE